MHVGKKILKIFRNRITLVLIRVAYQDYDSKIPPNLLWMPVKDPWSKECAEYTARKSTKAQTKKTFFNSYIFKKV
jgi:hypothetical protein